MNEAPVVSSAEEAVEDENKATLDFDMKNVHIVKTGELIKTDPSQ